MAGTEKFVRFKLAWQDYRVGDVIQPSGTLRDWLVGNGYADVIDAGTVEKPLTRGLADKAKAAVRRVFK